MIYFIIDESGFCKIQHIMDKRITVLLLRIALFTLKKWKQYYLGLKT